MDDLKKIVSKRAKGYTVSETLSEYALIDGEMVETKRKVQKKYVPPDINAIKIMMDDQTSSLDELTDEELEAERVRLLDELRIEN